MRDSIAEACKTIEDNQTAQALHGLLSLKAELNKSSPTTTVVSSMEETLVRQPDGTITVISPTTLSNDSQQDISSMIIQQVQSDTSNGSYDAASTPTHSLVLAGTASATLADAAQHVREATTPKSSSAGDGTVTDPNLMFRLEQARQCNSEVLNVSNVLSRIENCCRNKSV